jgi:hypothetical protein
MPKAGVCFREMAIVEGGGVVLRFAGIYERMVC